MSTLVKLLDYEENFWECNPSLLSINKFKSLHNKDKSKNKSNSSRFMWAIAYLIDKNDNNPWRNIELEERKKLIANDILKDKKFNWDLYQDFVEEYLNRVSPLAEKKLYELLNKLEERTKFINSTEYSLDSYTEKGTIKKGTADQLDRMLSNTKKLYDLFFEIKDEFENDNDSSTKGNKVLSASEKKLI